MQTAHQKCAVAACIEVLPVKSKIHEKAEARNLPAAEDYLTINLILTFMRKFTSFMLMLLFAVTTWGQVAPTAGTLYRIKNVATGFYLQSAKYNNQTDGALVINEFASRSEAQFFVLETAGNNTYYLKQTINGTDYYVYNQGHWNSSVNSNGNKQEYTIELLDETESIYKLVRTSDNGCLGTDNTAAGSSVYANKTVDNNGRWQFIEVPESEYNVVSIDDINAEYEAAKTEAENVKTAKTGLVAEEKLTAISNAISAAETAYATLEITDGTITKSAANEFRAHITAITTATDKAKYIQSADELANGTIYAICPDNRGSWVVDSEAGAITSTTNAEVNVDTSSEAQQFAILKSNKGSLYLYSISEEKFVTKSEGYTAFSEKPALAIELLEGKAEGDNKFVIAFVSGNTYYHIGISNGYNPALITSYNDLNDEGNNSYIEPVGTFNADDIVASLNECSITYNFMFDGVQIATQTSNAAIGGNYPAITTTFPYGITAAVPTGTTTGDEIKDITLTVEKELPFETAETVEGITKWYYAQMHTFNDSYMKFIQDNNDGIVEWADNTFEAGEIDSHLWGFVGDAFGVKVINKHTGNAIVSTSGDAVTGDAANATEFVVSKSTITSNEAYFCLKYPGNDNYLNAQGSKVASWYQADNGSSLFVTEYKEFNASISSVEYATLFLDFATFIPEGVTANAITTTGTTNSGYNYVEFAEVSTAIPANEGVVLQGEEGEYTFKRAPKATAIENNLLEGTVEDATITAAENTTYYVLGNIDGEVGLYAAEITDGGFLNNAGKAYMPITTTEANAIAFYSFNFDWGGTTGIESIEGTTENIVKGIYDLTGRKIESITAPGIYIIDGVKTLVK